MKKNLLFLAAFFYTGFVFSQDSSDRKAVAKQSNVNNSTTANDSDKSNLNQSTRGTTSINSTDAIPQTTGDYKEKRRITISENGVKDEPK